LKGNFIRGSHYPQDPRFLDRCDERGVLVWEEALAWGNYGKQLTDPWFLANQVGTANAMLDRDTNHPSIILWGFFNEGQTDLNTSCPAYQTMASTFKGRDPSRLVTWADNRGPSSLCLEYADVVSFNYYPGWYNGPAEGIFSTWADRGAWVAEHYPDKPFIISETGAGGILGDHNRSATNSSEPARWSLEYQVVVDRDDAMVAMVSENITGISLWQFCDIKVDQSNTSTGRPGGINNKGVVSQHRDPKPAAAAVGKAYTKAV
jgi:beta-glucuronidase